MSPTDTPLGICVCGAIKHALSPRQQELTRELIRMAEAAGNPDLAYYYSARLEHCETAYNPDLHKRVA